MSEEHIGKVISGIDDRHIGKVISGIDDGYIEKIISGIDDRYIEESIRYKKRGKNPSARIFRTAGRAAACLAGLFLLSMSVLSIAAAAGVLPAYSMLSHIYPDIAQKLTPVNMSCTDNGIEMRVEAVYVHGDSADVYISMRDLEGDRIDGTTDLFDSYRIRTSAGRRTEGMSVSGCGFVEYDEKTKTATFLVSLQQTGEDIADRKMIFSVSRFLSGKQEATAKLPEIRLQEAPEITQFRPEEELEIRGSGGSTAAGFISQEDVKGYLYPDDGLSISPADGVSVTGYGFIDGKLHIQAHYEDIVKYDNHGYIELEDEEGNIVYSSLSVSFWDEEKTGSYEEYVFDIGPDEDLSGYAVQGYFVTCSGLYEGDWEVTFPIENRVEKKD